MRCQLCGQGSVDGAVDQIGDFVCVDCWADGSAQYEGRKARAAMPAQGVIPTSYPSYMYRHFVDKANGEVE